MFYNQLKWIVILFVWFVTIKSSNSERFPVKVDRETGELYYEQETTTGLQKVVIRQADVEYQKEEKKSVKTSGGIKLDKSGIGIQFTREKHWQHTVSYSRKGGKIELPLTEACLLDAGCRESVLGTVNNSIAEDGRKSLEKIN